MININRNHNESLQKKCRPLYNYVQYVTRISDNKKSGMPAKKAVNKAARSFYANGASVELIAKSLDMTPEQVKEIVHDVIVVG